jgi:hypothetical protein
MSEALHIWQRTFHHLVGALPQLRPFSDAGSTVYAIVVPPEPEEVTLSGPTLTIKGAAGWPEVASTAVREFFSRKRRCAVVALLIVSIKGVWHCAVVSVPTAEFLGCDDATPLSCANSVLADAAPH